MALLAEPGAERPQVERNIVNFLRMSVTRSPHVSSFRPGMRKTPKGTSPEGVTAPPRASAALDFPHLAKGDFLVMGHFGWRRHDEYRHISNHVEAGQPALGALIDGRKGLRCANRPGGIAGGMNLRMTHSDNPRPSRLVRTPM